MSSKGGDTLVASESCSTHETLSKDEQTAQDDASECVVSPSNNTLGIRASGQRSAEEQKVGHLSCLKNRLKTVFFLTEYFGLGEFLILGSCEFPTC